MATATYPASADMLLRRELMLPLPREEGCEPDSVARPDRPEGGGVGLQRKDAAAAQKSPNLQSEWKVCFCTMGEEGLRNG